MPLQSFENRNTNFTNRENDGSGMKIQVHQSIELKSVAIEDDDSQKNLVTEGWTAGCYSLGRDGDHDVRSKTDDRIGGVRSASR